MAKKKKQVSHPVSQEDNIQAQQVIEHYHQIAATLHTSTSQSQAETALAEINTLSENAQMALLKALAKERHTDAADVLIAINELSPTKDVRKEARRSLIQLEGLRIYPQWKPPVQQALAAQISTAPLHFWKGYVTDSRDSGEVQLLLCWETVEDSTEVRILSFLLDFRLDGVKDFFTRIESKRNFDLLVAQMSDMYSVKTKDCSLAEGRRLLLDALAVNKQHGTVPYRDYRNNLSLVNRLILEVPGLDEDEEAEFDEIEEVEEESDLKGLTPQQVVTTFVDSWADGDYDTAYDLLSSESPLREGLSVEQWYDRREAWLNETNPGELVSDFVHEREPQKSGLWLPFGKGRSPDHKEIEAGWSIEFDEPAQESEVSEEPQASQTSLAGTLPELPQATAIYAETGRHWFWTTYTLIQEQGEWRIQSMTDEGMNAQSLPREELQRRIQEHDRYLEEFARKHSKPVRPQEVQQYVDQILWRMLQTIYCCDALIKQSPLDRSAYEKAASRTLFLEQYERCIVYVEQMAQRFNEERGPNLRALAAIRRQLSERYLEEGDNERAERCQEFAEEALNESLALEDSFEAHISLAELLIDMQERLDEAENHLLQAKAMITEPSDEAHIEMHLGEIAMERKRYQEALSHYQRVIELTPNSAESWFDIASAYQMLKNFEEAEKSYKRAIELQPDDEDLYYALGQMYSENKQSDKAFEIMEEGINNNPNSTSLLIYMATMYLESGDIRQSEIFLEKAERIDPQSDSIRMLRQLLKMSKGMLGPNVNKLDRPKKKRGR